MSKRQSHDPDTPVTVGELIVSSVRRQNRDWRAQLRATEVAESRVDLGTPLAQRLASIIRDLWGKDPDSPDAAPTQAMVWPKAGYQGPRGLEKALQKEPGLLKVLTARRPEPLD